MLRRLPSTVLSGLLRRQLSVALLPAAAAALPHVPASRKADARAWGVGPPLSALAASALFATQASAEAASPPPSAPPDPAQALRGLARLSDAKEVVLYQYAVCPFCNKLRAFLDYHRVPYKIVEVNPLSKKELKSWSSYTKVPVLVVDGEQLNDSSFIIKALSAKLEAGRKGRKQSPAAAAEEEQWFRWVDTRFVHVLTPNIYRTPSEAFQTFDYISKVGNFGFFDRELARWSGAVIMYGLSHTKLKKKHGIVNERESLYEEVNKWIAALGSRKFLGGEAPSLADLAFFGVLRAVETFDTFADVMRETQLRPWYDNMVAALAAGPK